MRGTQALDVLWESSDRGTRAGDVGKENVAKGIVDQEHPLSCVGAHPAEVGEGSWFMHI